MWVSVLCRILLLCFLFYPNQFLPLRQCVASLLMVFELLRVSDVLVTEVSLSPRQRGRPFWQ
jgi:hypothetical protein